MVRRGADAAADAPAEGGLHELPPAEPGGERVRPVAEGPVGRGHAGDAVEEVAESEEASTPEGDEASEAETEKA